MSIMESLLVIGRIEKISVFTQKKAASFEKRPNERRSGATRNLTGDTRQD